MKKPWKRFFFESNLFFDHIENMDGWNRLKEAYPEMSDERLLDVQEATYGGFRTEIERKRNPNFGMRSEHDGEKTLRDFFFENGMTLD